MWRVTETQIWSLQCHFIAFYGKYKPIQCEGVSGVAVRVSNRAAMQMPVLNFHDNEVRHMPSVGVHMQSR